MAKKTYVPLLTCKQNEQELQFFSLILVSVFITMTLFVSLSFASKDEGRKLRPCRLFIVDNKEKSMADIFRFPPIEQLADALQSECMYILKT